MSQNYKTKIDLIERNRYSRPGKKIDSIKGLVLHWVANPKSTPEGNRNFFNNRKLGKDGFGSAHEIIGIDGTRLQCIPEEEMAYHVGSKTYTKDALRYLSRYPNNCTYGVELCHKDWTGEFSDDTLDSAAERCAELCTKYNLDPISDIWTHQQVVGWKECPRWFVKNPEELEKFKLKVREILIMNELLDWQRKLGRESVEKLAKKGIINNPEEWSQDEKLAAPAPGWLIMALIDRVTEKKER